MGRYFDSLTGAESNESAAGGKQRSAIGMTTKAAVNVSNLLILCELIGKWSVIGFCK